MRNGFALRSYGEMLARIKTATSANWNIAEEKKRALDPVWDWAEKFPGSFSAAETDGSGMLGDYRKVAEGAFASLVPSITGELLFMDIRPLFSIPPKRMPPPAGRTFLISPGVTTSFPMPSNVPSNHII